MNGSVFYFYQPRSWVSELPKNFKYATATNNSDYKRWQAGADFGGPPSSVRLAFSYVSPGEIEEGVRRLGRLVAAPAAAAV